MELVERHTQLAELAAAHRDARAGRGSMVLVTGEAGAGKTALVRRFASGASRVLWGVCDELVTPRPLGPFRDLLGQLPGGVRGALPESGAALLDAILIELDRPPHPTVVLVEDAHWADDATLDGVRFLGRRVGRAPALLVVTFRDAEVPADHPLRLAIGAVPPDDVRRVRLPPLSRHGVAQLAGTESVDDLYRLTGGNPFYVTEVLAAAGGTVPATVQDAVMTRVGRLGRQGRACVETAAVVPGRVERGVCDVCGVSDGLEEATSLGILRAEGTLVSFTHELARQAIEHSLPPTRRREINHQVLEVLIGQEADPAVLTHHAVQAGDAAAVARYAPVAGRRAAALDSHREAAAHFRQAIDRAEHYPPDELAALWYEYARECNLTERHEQAERAARRAIDLHSRLGDEAGQGSDLTLLSDILWFQGRSADAEQASARAVEILQQLAADTALAWAYAQHAKLLMAAWRPEEAARWGEQAIALARQRGETEVLVHALNTVGVTRWTLPPFDNGTLRESLELARRNGFAAQAGRAYLNLLCGYRHFMGYAEAERYLADGLAFCEARDLITPLHRLLEYASACHFEQGRWPEAEHDARRSIAAGGAARVLAYTILGLIEARRGDQSAEETVAEAQRLADETGYVWDLIPIGLARVELAWLRGDPEPGAPLAREMLELARRYRSARWIGEAALWLHRAGALGSLPPGALEPYALQVEGRWREAAATWAELGRPYEQADALADAPAPEPLLEALGLLDRLGAKPRAAMVRRRLASMGVTSVPRGPRGATRVSPAGLTARQTEILHLLADGLTYQEIAQRLHLSVKTVDHHVAAVRQKLEVTTRARAVAAGRRLGILPAELRSSAASRAQGGRGRELVTRHKR